MIANDYSCFCRFLASFRNGSGQFYLTSSSHAHQSLITIQYNWCTAGLLPSTHDDRPGEMMFWLFEPETQAVPDTMGKYGNEWNWIYITVSCHELVLLLLDVFFYQINNNHLVLYSYLYHPSLFYLFFFSSQLFGWTVGQDAQVGIVVLWWVSWGSDQCAYIIDRVWLLLLVPSNGLLQVQCTVDADWYGIQIPYFL